MAATEEVVLWKDQKEREFYESFAGAGTLCSRQQEEAWGSLCQGHHQPQPTMSPRA